MIIDLNLNTHYKTRLLPMHTIKLDSYPSRYKAWWHQRNKEAMGIKEYDPAAWGRQFLQELTQKLIGITHLADVCSTPGWALWIRERL
jgi:hypothetical protein